jgi:hypothetical protein
MMALAATGSRRSVKPRATAPIKIKETKAPRIRFKG